MTICIDGPAKGTDVDSREEHVEVDGHPYELVGGGTASIDHVYAYTGDIPEPVVEVDEPQREEDQAGEHYGHVATPGPAGEDEDIDPDVPLEVEDPDDAED